MSFTPPQPYVPNNPLTLSKNLRFVTPGGNPVTRQFPDEYITNIGNTLSIQIDNYNLILASLNNTNEVVIPAMQDQIDQILTSGAIAIPNVSAGCLTTSGTGSLPMSTVVSLLVSNSCAYNNIFGPVSALAQAVATQCANLNTAPAFSQNSAMTGLPGWKSTPITVSDTINNEWLTICDSRAGITKALNTITPACSQVTIAFVAQIPNFMTGFNFWFEGYTFIPTGFADGGSAIIITDGQGGIITQPINIITLSTTPGAYNIVTSGSTLSSQTEQYTVTLNTNVSNSSAGITCQKTTLGVTGSPISGPFTSVGGPFGPTPSLPVCCSDIGNFTAVTSLTSGGTTSLPLITTLTYTPRFVQIIAKDATTRSELFAHGYWIQYISGGAILYNTISAGFDSYVTVNIDWIAYR